MGRAPCERSSSLAARDRQSQVARGPHQRSEPEQCDYTEQWVMADCALRLIGDAAMRDRLELSEGAIGIGQALLVVGVHETTAGQLRHLRENSRIHGLFAGGAGIPHA